MDDVDAARDDLVARGVDVSEVFHYAGGPFNNAVGRTHASAGATRKVVPTTRLPRSRIRTGTAGCSRRSQTRLPGREWKSTRARAMDVATLAELLHETEEHHGHYEKTHAEHHWWDWYAPYLSARQNGSSPEEAAAAADRYMEEVLHVLPR